MCHTPSSSDDEPTEDFDIRHIVTKDGAFMELIQTKFKAPEERDIPVEEQQTAAYRYMLARYTDGEFTPTEAQAKVIEHIYNKMVSRETDGPDPLVQEPKGKP